MEGIILIKGASLLIGFILITLMIIKLYLSHVRKSPFKVTKRLVQTIVVMCITKVVLEAIDGNLFGTIAWTFNTGIWIIINYMDWVKEENVKRILNREPLIDMKIKDAFSFYSKQSDMSESDNKSNYKNF